MSTPSTRTMRPRRTDLAAALVLVLLPLAVLGNAVFGSELFVPSDPARFPPASLLLSPEERALVENAPANDDVTELPFLVVPEMKLAARELAAGRFPGWNPYARFGAPLYANGLAAMAYPPNAVLLVGPHPERGLAVAAWISYAIAGLSMFALLRALHLGAASALFGAVTFMLCGTMSANAHFYMRQNALIWLPAMLLGILRCMRAESARARVLPALVLAIAVAMTWLAGFPPFAITSTAFAASFAGFACVATARRSGGRDALRLGSVLAGSAALGLALAMVQLAPLLAYFPESSRDLAPPPNEIAAGGFDPFGFLGYVLPTAFGVPDGSPPSYATSPLALLLQSRTHWEGAAPARAGDLLFPSNYNFTEYAVFVGALPLLLAPLGLLSGRRRSTRWVLLALGAVFALVATAPSWLAQLYELPGMPKTPMRWIAPLCIVVATLAAFGFDALVSGRLRRAGLGAGVGGLAIGATCAILLASDVQDIDFAPELTARYAHFVSAQDGVAQMRAFVGDENLGAAGERLASALGHASWTFALAGLWILGWAAGALRGPVFRWLTLAAVAIELLSFATVSNVTRPMPVDASDTPYHDFLRAERDRRAESGGLTFMRAAKAPKTPIDLPSGLTFPDRLRDVTAYAFSDPWSARLFEAEYGKGQMYRGVWPNAFPDDRRLTELPLFDLLGVDFIVSAEPLVHAGARVGPRLQRDDGRDFYVYERPHPLPRAFVVPRMAELPDDEAVVEALRRPDLDPRASVFVTPSERARLPALRGGSDDAAAGRTVRFVRDTPNDIVLEVEAGPAGYLVLADACLDGWSATVAEVDTEIARGNLFMRVVPIGSDRTEVRFRYRPPGLLTGSVVSGIALILALLLLVSWLRGSSRRPDRVETPL